MNYEEFEKKIYERGYGIVAMNHYSLNGKRHTYCVVLSKDNSNSFQAESEISEEVFESLYNQIEIFSNKQTIR